MSVGQGQSGGGGDAQAATVAALGGSGSNGQQASGQPSGDGDGQGQQTQQSQGTQGLAEGFLGRVNPAHRAIVEPYVRQWDAGVTRRFQELHGQLQPYQQLGDPETLSQAMQLYEMIDTNPEQVVALIQEAIGQGQEQTPVPAEQQVAPQGQQEPQGQEAPGIPPEVAQQLNTMQQVLEALAQRVLDADSSQQEAQEDQQLDQYFELLKQEFGDFDEDYVIAKMLAGMDGEQAVQAFQQSIQGRVNERAQSPNIPPILSGGGSVPTETQRISSAPRSDIKNLVTNILAQAQQG